MQNSFFCYKSDILCLNLFGASAYTDKGFAYFSDQAISFRLKFKFQSGSDYPVFVAVF